jgi:hypothetical protein
VIFTGFSDTKLVFATSWMPLSSTPRTRILVIVVSFVDGAFQFSR